MPQYVIVKGPEWERVSVALREVDATMERNLRDAMKRDADKYAEKAQKAVLSLPTPRNAGHTGLRARVAAGVHVINNGPAGVRIVTGMDKPDERIIPLGLDRKEGWRHPLFGDKNHWYRNPGYSWFRETIAHGQDEFERDLADVLEKAAEKVASQGGISI